jgi:Outer membrane protein beta-barrel domain
MNFQLTISTRMTMKRYVYSLGAVMLLGCAMSALAQGYSFGPAPAPASDNTPANVYFAGGYTAATGESSNFVDNGWNIGGGVQWRPHSGPISLRWDLEYSRNLATSQLLNEGTAAKQIEIDHGWSDLFSTDLDAVFDIRLTRNISTYVLAGGGGAIRRISLTHTVGNGTTCNDWAGFCDAGFYPGDVLVERKTTGRWEWNAGVGLSVGLGGGESFFVEARYMEVETPVPTAFVPVRVGFML